MRQIDIMVNAKKVEWDGQLHVLQFHLDKKKKENGILRIEVEAKVHEVGYTVTFLWAICSFISFKLHMNKVACLKSINGIPHNAGCGC